MKRTLSGLLLLLLLSTATGFVILAGGGILHGFVSDGAGQPVTGLTAVVTHQEGSFPFSGSQALTLGGEFVLDPPVGSYLVELEDGAGQVVDYRQGVNIFDDITTFQFFEVDLPTHCQENLGHGTTGGMTLTLCGDDLTTAGSSADLTVYNGTPSSVVFMPISLGNNPTSFGGGTLVPLPLLTVVPVTTNTFGTATLPVPGGAGASVTLYLQVLDDHGTGYRFSNAVEAVLGT